MNYFREKARGKRDFCIGEEGENSCGFIQIGPRKNYRCEKKNCAEQCPWYSQIRQFHSFLKITITPMLGGNVLLNV